jgi:hypothetical protein
VLELHKWTAQVCALLKQRVLRQICNDKIETQRIVCSEQRAKPLTKDSACGQHCD